MASKNEATAAIRDGIARVEGAFGNLTDAQLATTVHSGENGWTVRDMLAHLAGRERGYGLMFRLAESSGGAPPTGGFDVDAWNKARIAERADKGRDELLTEMRTVHESLIARIDALSEEDMQREIQSIRGITPLGELMRLSGGVHSTNHALEVEQVLGLATSQA